MRRLPLLSRLAARYAVRHRGQTVRALLGLLVCTTVLTVGLGLGESIGRSLEEAALARFGEVDVLLSSPRPFDAAVADRLAADPTVRPYGLAGAPALSFTGSAAHPAADLAEAFATVRGVTAAERAAFGPLRAADGSVIPEPRAGEAVISATLAKSLGATVGDRIVLRTPSPGAFSDLRFATVNYTGTAGTPLPLPGVGPIGGAATLEVGEDALGLLAFAVWPAGGGTVTIEASGPGGVAFANESDEAPVVLVLEPPLAAGTWTIRVTASEPTVYNGTAGVAYPPASLVAGATRLEARVSGIAAAEGRAGLTGRPTAVVPLADLQAAAGLRGKVNTVAWAVNGNADDAASAIRDALPEDMEENVNVVAVKEQAIRNSAEGSANLTGFLLVMSGFTLLAGMLLAFALFSALVQERRSELGIARALGLSRGEVAVSMTLEGSLYAGAAAVIGLVLGLGILLAFLYVLSGFVVAEGGPPLSFRVSRGTMLLAFLVGTLLPLATIALASMRFARLDPSRAIRGIPEDPRTLRRAGYVVGAALAVVGLLLSIAATGRLLGLPIAFAGAAIALATARQRVLAGLAVAAAFVHTTWTLYTFDAWPENFRELDPILTLSRGVVLALVFAAVAVASPAPYMAILRGAGRLRTVPRSAFVAVKYLVARRGAAGLTIAMIALVVVVVTVMGTLMLLFGAQIPQDEAGYQVMGESALRLDAFPAPLPADLARQIERTDFVYRHFEFRPTNFTIDGQPVGGDDDGLRSFLGVTRGFAEGNHYQLLGRAPEYATDREAWDAVARGDGVILPSWYPDDEFGPGDRVRLATVLGGEKEYVVAGLVRSDYVWGAYLSAADVRAMGFPTGTFLFVRVAEDANPDTVAHRLTSTYGESGATFVSIPEEAARFAQIAQAFVLVFESFLSLGLFVGLAATGFLASRAVHERARDIGTLRALGFEESDIRRAFVVESMATSAIGLALGIGIGILVAHSVWWREIRGDGYPFVLPWLILGLFTAAVLALSAFAAWRPARRAARLPPAIAVRHSE